MKVYMKRSEITNYKHEMTDQIQQRALKLHAAVRNYKLVSQ